jgi:hypothetical protein
VIENWNEEITYSNVYIERRSVGMSLRADLSVNGAKNWNRIVCAISQIKYAFFGARLLAESSHFSFVSLTPKTPFAVTGFSGLRMMPTFLLPCVLALPFGHISHGPDVG